MMQIRNGILLAMKQSTRHVERFMSTKSAPLVDVAVNNKTGVATVTMQRPPVNSLNLELLSELSATLDTLTANKSRGLIITSASPSVFCAGLDIMEMYKPDVKRATEFWTTLQDVWLKLYGSSYPTAAAINGHAPAGGCLLSLSCEYRVMVNGEYSIGLNETQLGIVAPTWFQDSLRYVISPRQAEIALTTGKMFTVDEALKEGMIDETATDKADAITKCEQFMKRFERISPQARFVTKQLFRSKPINNLKKNREADIKLFIDTITSPSSQKTIEVYLQMLKQKTTK